MKLTKQNLQNFLDSLKKHNHELKDVVFYDSDSRLGKKVALAVKGESGSVEVKTDYITYSEMNQFLRGYMFKSNNRFDTSY